MIVAATRFERTSQETVIFPGQGCLAKRGLSLFFIGSSQIETDIDLNLWSQEF